MSRLKGLATGIGSLPYSHDIGADRAIDLIFAYVPNIPFWPQLPKRDVREGMIIQFSENFPCIKFAAGGLEYDPANREAELEQFYEKIIADNFNYFKISPQYAYGLDLFYRKLNQELGEFDLNDIGYVKCQITGPFTFAAGLPKDEKGIPLLHDPVFMQAVIKGLAMKALWQVRLFQEFADTLVFMDEPYLGCFGSGYTPLQRDDVIKGLNEIAETIKSKSPQTLLGVHCCGNTDWSIFTEVKKIDIINFDAYGFMEKFSLYSDDIKKFLERGGIICWGIVPTQDLSGQDTPDFLLSKLMEGVDSLVKKGIDRELLLNNLMLSPSCGLGALDVAKSEAIFKLLAQVSAIYRKNS